MPSQNIPDGGDERDAACEPVPLEITDILDLHTFRPSEIADAVGTYLEEARRRGFATVRIIHGKGIGVQRERVRSVLGRTPFVVQFQDAPMEAGSWGATIAWLKNEPVPEDLA
jgi:dsDNA-specific endonuclease/ATPase MutS2